MDTMIIIVEQTDARGGKTFEDQSINPLINLMVQVDGVGILKNILAAFAAQTTGHIGNQGRGFFRAVKYQTVIIELFTDIQRAVECCMCANAEGEVYGAGVGDFKFGTETIVQEFVADFEEEAEWEHLQRGLVF